MCRDEATANSIILLPFAWVTRCGTRRGTPELVSCTTVASQEIEERVLWTTLSNNVLVAFLLLPSSCVSFLHFMLLHCIVVLHALFVFPQSLSTFSTYIIDEKCQMQSIVSVPSPSFWVAYLLTQA